MNFCKPTHPPYAQQQPTHPLILQPTHPTRPPIPQPTFNLSMLSGSRLLNLWTFSRYKKEVTKHHGQKYFKTPKPHNNYGFQTHKIYSKH